MSQPYTITPAVAEILMGAVGLKDGVRREVLDKLLGDRAAVLETFVQFIGLAQSVVENNREMIEIILITEGGLTDREAEKANLPTIFGALNGARLAWGIDPAGLCHGCAFRSGSCANQSPITTTDAHDCSQPGEDNFMCHENLDDRGNPTKACAGFAKTRVAHKKLEQAA